MALVAQGANIKVNGKWVAPGEAITTDEGKALKADDKKRLTNAGVAADVTTPEQVEALTAKEEAVNKVISDFNDNSKKLNELRAERAKLVETTPEDTAPNKQKQEHAAKIAEVDAKIVPLQTLYDAMSPTIAVLNAQGEETPAYDTSENPAQNSTEPAVTGTPTN